jgi:hypothetical protein
MHTIGLNIFDVTSDISNLSTISRVNSEIQQNFFHRLECAMHAWVVVLHMWEGEAHSF